MFYLLKDGDLLKPNRIGLSWIRGPAVYCLIRTSSNLYKIRFRIRNPFIHKFRSVVFKIERAPFLISWRESNGKEMDTEGNQKTRSIKKVIANKERAEDWYKQVESGGKEKR